jgi:uncharacterized protein YcbK (DUF882 family)
MSVMYTRRRLMQSLVAGGLVMPFARLASSQEGQEASKLPERRIELFNTHTHESVDVVFKRGEDYDAAALESLKKILRDRRNGDVHDMDPRLYDLLHDLALAANCPPHYEIISGYRSAESNDKMSARPGSGVAKKSLHMQGRAIDVRLKNCTCARLRDLAIAAKTGGVGYYAKSDFVHLDTGSFRTWVG